MAWGAVGLVVLLGVTAGAMWLHRDRERAKSCDRIRAGIVDRRQDVPVAVGGDVAVILGDSWAAGAYLPDPRESAWPKQLGEARGWTTYVDAIALTGFTNGGYCGGQQFGTRVAEVLARKPAVVMVEGGLNDDRADLGDVEAAAAALLNELHNVPRVVVVGPPSAPSRKQDAAIDNVLRRVTANAGREFVSTQDFKLDYRDDGLHLRAEAHDAFAQQIDQQLAN